MLAFAVYAGLLPAERAAAQSVSERLQMCGACHGEDGNSKLERIPSLAGQPEFYLLNQLVLIREAVRMVPAMQDAVKGLSDGDIQTIAAHFAKLPAKPSDEPIDAAQARKGAELASKILCVSCHLPDLSGREQMPRLARQRLDYLRYSLKALRDGQRGGADPLMVEAILGHSDADIEALANYAASK